MKNLTLVPAPSALSGSAQWWPDLYVKRARKLYRVTPEQAGQLMEALRDNRGASTTPDIKLFDVTGAEIGRVSYNGRVWLADIEGDVEVPQSGRKTCAANDADGWRDHLSK